MKTTILWDEIRDAISTGPLRQWGDRAEKVLIGFINFHFDKAMFRAAGNDEAIRIIADLKNNLLQPNDTKNHEALLKSEFRSN